MARTKYTPQGSVGSGQRFSQLTSALSRRGASNPKALAAWIGRKKYGPERMAQMSARGRKRG